MSGEYYRTNILAKECLAVYTLSTWRRGYSALVESRHQPCRLHAERNFAANIPEVSREIPRLLGRAVWPKNSPDLNLAENLRAILQDKVNKMTPLAPAFATSTMSWWSSWRGHGATSSRVLESLVSGMPSARRTGSPTVTSILGSKCENEIYFLYSYKHRIQIQRLVNCDTPCKYGSRPR